jgi:hypothetical protein
MLCVVILSVNGLSDVAPDLALTEKTDCEAAASEAFLEFLFFMKSKMDT